MSRKDNLARLLREGLPLVHLDVIDESGGHNVPKGSESHFKVVVVSEAFRGASRVARHQRIFALAEPELRSGLHALAIVAKTPEEWGAEEGVVPASPPCLGGERKRPVD